jgi:polyhydroxyalkanoate synthesis regulator phasin
MKTLEVYEKLTSILRELKEGDISVSEAHDQLQELKEQARDEASLGIVVPDETQLKQIWQESQPDYSYESEGSSW